MRICKKKENEEVKLEDEILRNCRNTWNALKIIILVYENWREEKLLAEYIVYRVRSFKGGRAYFPLYQDAFVGRTRNLWGLHDPYVIQLSQGIPRMKGTDYITSVFANWSWRCIRRNDVLHLPKKHCSFIYTI